jgi:electron transport complex protein RnfG
MVTRSIRFNSLVLSLFALVTALLLASTHLGTRDTIAAAERAAAQKTLLELFPAEQHDNDLLDDTLPVPPAYLKTLGLGRPAVIHVVRKGGEISGFVIPATAPDGYSGNIHMIVGIDAGGAIVGVRVTGHAETPGLGDKIELRIDPWILSFNGLSLGNPPRERWGVKKDQGMFDQFTGATITPRVVVRKVRDVLEFFREHRNELIEAAGDGAQQP